MLWPAEGLPPAPLVANAGYGDVAEFRDTLPAAGLAYAVGDPVGHHGLASGARSPEARARARPAPDARTGHRTDQTGQPPDPG